LEVDVQRRIVRRILTVVAALVGTASLLLVTAGPAQASAPGHYTGDGVRIRSCAHLNCRIDGLGYPGQSVTIHCYVYGDRVGSSTIWYRHRDNSTGVTGYSSEVYLDLNSGVIYHC
jgi:hypothetical protein